MISIQPQWVNKILNSEKIIEIRKTKPNCELPCRVYIYCTKNRHLALVVGGGNSSLFRCCDSETAFICGGKLGNGKIVAEFTLNKVEEFEFELWDDTTYESIANVYYDDETGERITNVFESDREIEDTKLLKDSCLSVSQLREYLGKGFSTCYAWHIDNLKIYDRPKEIDEFCKRCCLIHSKPNTQCFKDLCKHKYNCNNGLIKLTRPPQSWCYIGGCDGKD